MNINIPFEFNQKVHYVVYSKYTCEVKEGNIFGISIFKRNNELDIRIIFRIESVIIDDVFERKEEAIVRAEQIREKLNLLKTI